MRITGTVAWITGGSSGIGASLARELASRGATVAITARRAELLKQIAATAEGPGSVHPYPGDVRDREGLAGVADRIRGELGPIDIAVLGAGTWTQVDVEHWDSTAIRDHIDTNLLGMVNSLDALVPDMVRRRVGRIVGIASVAGYRGYTRAEPTAQRRRRRSACSSRFGSTSPGWACPCRP